MKREEEREMGRARARECSDESMEDGIANGQRTPGRPTLR